jgi:hypothetical protein
VRPLAETRPFFSREFFQRENEKPCKKLGFPSVRVAESDNAPALPGQGALESVKQDHVAAKYNFGEPKEYIKIRFA